MSVVSLARAAGVTGLSSKRRFWMVSTSLVLADISMMSTSFCFDDLRDDVAELGEAAVADFAGVRFRRLARGADGQRHVGVLGVGEDEVLAAARVGVDAGQLQVERFLDHVNRYSVSDGGSFQRPHGPRESQSGPKVAVPITAARTQ